MKRSNRKISKQKVKELAEQFQQELDKKLPITILPDGGIVYKDYLVKQNKRGNWAVYLWRQKDVVTEFYLKSCALMAAKAHQEIRLEKFYEIKRLDNLYWANYTDSQVFKYNMKNTKDYDRYQILLTRFEDSSAKERYYKEEISKMFKWSFV